MIGVVGERCFIVDAPGWYGGSTLVLSHHTTIREGLAALRDAGPGQYCLRLGDLRRGDTYYQVYDADDAYPRAHVDHVEDLAALGSLASLLSTYGRRRR